MTWTSGTASGHDNLLERFRKWICGHGTATTPAAAGGNTGNGTMSSVTTSPTTATETWTITCNNVAVPASEVFSVTGSVSGLQTAEATVGVAYESDNGEVAFTISDGAVNFILTDEFTFSTTEGEMTTDGNAWEEQTLNSETIVGCAWTRSGSTVTVTMSGHTLEVGEGVTISASSNTTALPNASYTLTAAGASTFGVTAGSSGSTSGTCTVTLLESHVYLKGLGNGGTDEIFVNLRSYKNVGAGYYNIELRGASGFSNGTGKTRTNQANLSALTDICLWNSTMPYWFIANARRFIIVAKVSTVYETAYAGLILPTGLPSEYPYPLAVGGSQSVTGEKYDLTSGAYKHRAFFNPNDTLQLLDKAGVWKTFTNYSNDIDQVNGNHYRTFPFAGSTNHAQTQDPRPIYPNIDGTYSIFPVTLLGRDSASVENIFGDLDGVYLVSGHNNASENIVQASGVDHLVVQNVFRTTPGDYVALALE
jgi:hypothetical protein